MEHGNESRTLAEIYHEETKYSEERLRNSPRVSLDPSQQPEPFKEYHSSRAVSLVPYLPFEDFPLAPEHKPSDEAVLTADPALRELSRVLYFSNGATAIYRGPHGLSLFRAAPSAGALYPTEIYVVTEGVEGIPDGLHNYSIRRHELVPVFDGSLNDELAVCCFGHPAVGSARTVIILTGVYERSAWRYQERSYRRVLLDTGHVLGNMLLMAEAEMLAPQPLGCFADNVLSQLFFFEAHQEGVLAVIPLLPTLGAETEGPRDVDHETLNAAHGNCLRKSSSNGKHNGEELFLSLHKQSSLELESLELVRPAPTPSRDTDPSGASDSGIALARTTIPMREGLHQIVLRRRSTRQFSEAKITLEQLGKTLDFGYRITYRNGLAWVPQPLQAPELLETYVVILDCEGLERGVYHYSPTTHELRLVATGDHRASCLRFCLGQEILHNASALVVHMTHLPNAVARYGNRAYRYMHLDAGTIGQGLNLGAVDLELGASGVGGFLDDEVNEVLELNEDHAVVYMTVLGTPATES